MPKPCDVTLPSDREVRVVRSFNAARKLVWDAHTKPALVRRWLLGPPGWDRSYTECFGFTLEEIYAEAGRSFESKLRAAGYQIETVVGLGYRFAE